jgi:hypothetical protein
LRKTPFFAENCLKSQKIVIITSVRGDNYTTVSYNARVGKMYNVTSSLVHSENKNIFSTLRKCSSLLQRWRGGCKFKNSRIGFWVGIEHLKHISPLRIGYLSGQLHISNFDLLK